MLLKMARELNLNVCGVAFHIGVGCQEYEIFRKAIKDSAEMFKFGKSLGHEMGRVFLVMHFNFSILQSNVFPPLRHSGHWRLS
jgi:hypothetical protein